MHFDVFGAIAITKKIFPIFSGGAGKVLNLENLKKRANN